MEINFTGSGGLMRRRIIINYYPLPLSWQRVSVNIFTQSFSSDCNASDFSDLFFLLYSCRSIVLTIIYYRHSVAIAHFRFFGISNAFFTVKSYRPQTVMTREFKPAVNVSPVIRVSRPYVSP